MKKTLSEELTTRGFVNQCTAESLAEVLDGPKRTVYHGIDPSADSAHAGNMVLWILLRHLVLAGHKVIFLVGGGTGMIGDPKPDAERTLQTPEQVESNVAKIKAQAERLIGGDRDITFVNNADWLLKAGLIEFLRDIGKHFTVNELVKKEAIARRMDGDVGISYTEFAYPLLQAFDYLTLHKEYGCDLQVGGSDQWGNIVSGVDLIRRKEQHTTYALTVPLIVDKATGKKFGKSEGNAVWLDAEKTSPFAFYQFWRNVADENVEDYLKLFTFISLDEIENIVRQWQQDPGARYAQKRLAEAVTTFVHGEQMTSAVVRASEALFGKGKVAGLTNDELAMVQESAPSAQVAAGDMVVDVLVASGLASSKREARTFIESGAVEIESEKVTDPEQAISAAGVFLLKRGKKQVCVVEVR